MISVLPADGEDESELSALTVEPLGMYWANLEKGTTNLPGGGGDSAREIPYFNSVRNFPLIFRGEVRNFPHAEFCLCKPL